MSNTVHRGAECWSRKAALRATGEKRRGGITSYVPGRTRASLPKYLQMSDVMTSRSMPSRGTKYSFCRAEAGIWEAGGGRVCCLDMVAEKSARGRASTPNKTD
jgi:hypothetical protein